MTDEKQLTHYVVQARDSVTGYWEDLTPKAEAEDYEAVNAQKAIQLAMKDYELKEGDFRAIPITSARIYSPKLKVKETTVW